MKGAYTELYIDVHQVEKNECIQKVKELEDDIYHKEAHVQSIERENIQFEKDLEAFKIRTEKLEAQVEKMEKDGQAVGSERMNLHKRVIKIEGENNALSL